MLVEELYPIAKALSAFVGKILVIIKKKDLVIYVEECYVPFVWEYFSKNTKGFANSNFVVQSFTIEQATSICGPLVIRHD